MCQKCEGKSQALDPKSVVRALLAASETDLLALDRAVNAAKQKRAAQREQARTMEGLD